MVARWFVLLGVVAPLATSGAAVGAPASATSAGTSMEPAGAVAKRLRVEVRKGPPHYRGIFDADSAPDVVASRGWNLVDVGTPATADGLPAPASGLVYAGDYDNSTCDWEIPDAALMARIAPMAGDPKVAGYDFSDEPDPYACPGAPAQHRARSQLIHSLDPGKFTLMVADSNSGQASLDQMPLWVGAADYVALDPYPCRWNGRCDYAWIDAIIAAADRAGLSYWGVIQAFADETWRWPTPREERHMLCQWAASRQSGYMVFSWSWAGRTLRNRPGLLRVLGRFNRKGTLPTCRGAHL
jgi:hypothetical protein